MYKFFVWVCFINAEFWHLMLLEMEVLDTWVNYLKTSFSGHVKNKYLVGLLIYGLEVNYCVDRHQLQINDFFFFFFFCTLD